MDNESIYQLAFRYTKGSWTFEYFDTLSEAKVAAEALAVHDNGSGYSDRASTFEYVIVRYGYIGTVVRSGKDAK